MSAEGGLDGTLNEMALSMESPTPPQNILAHLDDIGGPNSFPHIPVGWALAGDTPLPVDQAGGVALRRHAQRHGHLMARGASRTRAASAPNGITSSTSRLRFSRALKLPQPKSVNGVEQKPIEGVSMAYTFSDAKAPTRHRTQYFEMFGNRGIYHDGWTAVTKHSTPWLLAASPLPKFTEDKWELYNTNDDFSESQDLASKYPDKLKELQQPLPCRSRKIQCPAARRPPCRTLRSDRSRAGLRSSMGALR